MRSLTESAKDEFLEIQLASIEPKACFRKLKGVTPIPQELYNELISVKIFRR